LFSKSLREQSAILLELCRVSFKQIVTAESCTGGLLSACLTEIPGASDVFQRGFVTYSNDAKIKELRVSKSLIDTVGAVSEEVACAMAHGALACTPADLSLAITGVAGPGGGTKAKPVGLVHFAVAGQNTKTSHKKLIIPGDRSMVRMVSVGIGIDMLLDSARHL
jgi:nicotinamide-nucleotide amidase